MPDPANPTNRIPAAVLSALRELAGDAGTCSPTVAAIADLAEVSPSSVRRGLRELLAGGELAIDRSADGCNPSHYRLTPLPAQAVTPLPTPALTPLPSADLAPLSLAGARDRSIPSLRARSAGNGNRRAQLSAPAREPASARPHEPARTHEPAATLASPEQETPMADAEPDPDPNPAGAAIAAAAAECTRAGRPELDNAAKKRIGSVAKRMHREGVTIADLQAAAIYLAANGMSDLQAAYRSHLEARESSASIADLAEQAAASSRARADQPRHAITLAELAEVWARLQVYWPRVPLPPVEHAEVWIDELRPCPVEFVLQAAAQWSRRTDGQGTWPPTLGQLRTVTRRLYADQLTLEDARRGVALEQAIWRGEAKGDGTDPRNVGL